MVGLKNIFYFLFFLSFLTTGCESLYNSRPIMPIQEYEKMIAGRLDANYVGTKNCLSACHYHDTLRQNFDATTMGVQLKRESGMPLVDCESCHGPGSLAIEGLTSEKVEMDAKAGKKTSCDYSTLIDFKRIPAPAKSLICLKCHTANATFNLHNWNASVHSISDVSCPDCHNVHNGTDLRVRPRETAGLCFKCHQEIQAQFALPSRHPVQEKKIFCTDCHEPHGTINEKMLRKDTVKQTCCQCHGEKEGPFVFEHADNTEDCRTCHAAHGSVNSNLLIVPVPFLCLQCHIGHATGTAATVETKGAFYTRCTDCHSTIHGTDLPSVNGTGTFQK